MPVEVGEKKRDLLKLIEKLDISQTMYDNATEKYKNLSTFLQSKGIESDIYPQGSFAIGTVTRPYGREGDKNYDLDFICCLINKNKEETTPEKIKKSVGEVLSNSDLYNDKLQEEYDTCWTVEYAEVGDIGFNMDIVPCVEEDQLTKQQLSLQASDIRLMNTSIAITNKQGSEYVWHTNNPKGYREWFWRINERFVKYNNEILLEKRMYNSIEEIPMNMRKTSLQRVIQLLKRHRDVYFSRKRLEDYKPISAIITTVVSKIAEDEYQTTDINSLLDIILREISIYSEKQFLSIDGFQHKHGDKKIIQKDEEGWRIINPANPLDNLTDSWNKDPRKAKYFFDWLNQVEQDFLISFNKTDSEFYASLENAIGQGFVSKCIDSKKYRMIEPTYISRTPKPWRTK